MQAKDKEGIALLCKCLASVSMADGDLDSREIATQLSIVEQITGSQVSADDIVTASIETEDWEDFQAYLAQQTIDADFRIQILKACILVGRADDMMIDAEIERIYGVAQALGYTRMEVDEQFKVIR